MMQSTFKQEMLVKQASSQMFCTTGLVSSK